MLRVSVIEAVEEQWAFGAIGASAESLCDGGEPEPTVGEIASLTGEGANGQVTLATPLRTRKILNITTGLSRTKNIQHYWFITH